MTRITGGRWGGRRLITPRGSTTRPTAEKVRAAIANSLAAAGAIDGAAVLDLYAGTGALGLELASWGAGRVVLVDSGREAQRAIERNIVILEASDATLVGAAARAFASTPGEAFDIVVADPPYEVANDAVTALLADLHTHGRLRPGADLIVERSARDGDLDWPDPLRSVKSRRYGDTRICYGRAP